MIALLTTLCLALALSVQAQTNGGFGANLPPTCATGTLFMRTGASAGACVCGATDTWTCPSAPSGDGVPTGSILLIKSGTCPTGYTEDTDFNGKTVIGTLAASSNVGTTGGADSITPAGNNAAPTITWPAGVPSLTMNSFNAVINHTHTVTVTDPGHTHVERIINSGTAGTVGVQGASAASNANASNSPTASNTTGITATTANPAGGVASITPTGSIAWPAGVPTATAPVFTGTQFDNRSAFLRVIACRKT